MRSLTDLVAQAESLAVDLEEDDIPRVRRRMEELRAPRMEEKDGSVRTGLSEAVKRSLEGVRVVETDGEDVASFLKGEREAAVLRAVEAVRADTEALCKRRTEEACQRWWREEKSNILGALASGDKILGSIASGDKTKLLTLPNIDDSFRRGTGVTQIGLKLGKDETSYARLVSFYVDSLLTDSSLRQPLSICELLLSHESSPMITSKCTELSEVARLISRYCSLSPRQTAGQRQSDDNLSRQMVSAAITHLQFELFSYIQHYIGSFSNNRSIMVTFLNSQMSPLFQSFEGGSFEDGCINSVPVWPLIYLCLRVGLEEEAIQVAKEASSNIGDWHIWLNEYVSEGRVSNDNTRKIVTDYKRNVRGTNDGYKRLIYCLVGGCDIEDNHPQVLLSVDDFMWARLSHLRKSYFDQDSLQISLNRSRRSSFFEHQSLFQLQRLISEEYGESHFQAQQQPITYFKLLLLCQLHEPAVAFLARFDNLRCHSVHIGLVLWFHSLLMVPENIKAPLLSRSDQDAQGISKLNLARLVALYTRKFESLHPKETLDLFFLLSNLPNDDNNTFVNLASTLIVEHGHLDLILGVGEDGDSRSLVLRYGRGMREDILNCVSSRFLEGGRNEDACDALIVAGKLTEAATILSNLLASSLTLPSTHQQDSLRLRSKAEYLCQHSQPCKEVNTLSKVLDVVTFMSLSHQGDIDAAIIALDRIDLLPSSIDTGRIRSSVEAFRGLPEIVRNLIPSILVTAMRLMRQAAIERKSLSMESMTDVRRRASALITFTGQLPYRMPADVYASLSQLEMDIN